MNLNGGHGEVMLQCKGHELPLTFTEVNCITMMKSAYLELNIYMNNFSTFAGCDTEFRIRCALRFVRQ